MEKREIIINGEKYEFNIHLERRSSTRASITNRGVNIRIPIYLPSFKRQQEIENLISWASNKIKSKPHIVKKKRIYLDGTFLKTPSRIYQLKIEFRDSKKNFTRQIGNVIHFKISDQYGEFSSQKYISKQLQKILAKNHHDELVYHVNRLNDAYFNKEVGKISYKYTTSRWGVCKTKTKEINLSTRLILAPLSILEYVIIHELAHLIMPNHSPEFWNIVKKVDPHYKLKMKWLKENAGSLEI
ncbi:hypothetical protein COU57_01435 [Candidatus Pacearchaeota archaeon CG10_big_fil_rev_8_21_14_0_10_32_14]|nr:MAG: hypothetical protein COU57_01435 [Candidatus Pacearchaeota archaeon CG10_big_fil_rev_8_21_14_0_10_32_14]